MSTTMTMEPSSSFASSGSGSDLFWSGYFGSLPPTPKQCGGKRSITREPQVPGQVRRPSILPLTQSANLQSVLPPHAQNRWLCHEAGLVPCTATDSALQLSLGGNGTVTTSSSAPYANGVTLHTERRGGPNHPHPPTCFVWKQDNDSAPIALGLQDTRIIQRAFDIYGRQPLLPNDKPGTYYTEDDSNNEATEGSHLGVPFYPWYRISAFGVGAYERSISVWDGRAYKPMLKLSLLLGSSPHNNRANAKVLVTPLLCGTNTQPTFAVLQRVPEEHGSSAAHASWELTMAQNVDPALILAASAVMEDFVRML